MSTDKYVITGNVSDNPFAIDVGQLLGINKDLADLVSLKAYANSEFCPRFINEETDMERIGRRLEDRTVIICSGTSQGFSRNHLAMRNLILARAAKDNGASRVVLVEPDLFYSAQDRGPHRLGPHEENRSDDDCRKFDGQPFTALLYAQLLKSAGVDSVLTVHNHSRKVQELYRDIFDGDFHNLIPADLYAHYITKSDIVQVGKDGSNLVLCAPDKGALAFVNMVYESLGLSECKRVILSKVRTGERQVASSIDPSSDITLEEIEGKDVIVLDDMVRTGSTIVESCKLLQQAKPGRVVFGVTHFHTSEEARENLNSRFIDEIMTTSSIPTILNKDQQGRLRKKIVVLKIAKWISRYLLNYMGEDSSRFEKDFYAIDMSSKNPRWPPPAVG